VRGEAIALCIDGARMLSPGILRHMLDTFIIHQDPLVANGFVSPGDGSVALKKIRFSESRNFSAKVFEERLDFNHRTTYQMAAILHKDLKLPGSLHRA
jgi:hypothetical protein